MWGFQDEVWWSRFAQPNLSSWCEEDRTLRLVEQVKQKDDPDPKALACYGILLRWMETDELAREKMLLRFVDARPVSDITIQFLDWTCAQLEVLGKSVLAMIWDNARWHTSKAVRTWIREHNQSVKRSRKGVRILSCFLPIKSPWLNPIEPKWVHGKRAVAEPTQLLSMSELMGRVCAYYHCELTEPIAQSDC